MVKKSSLSEPLSANTAAPASGGDDGRAAALAPAKAVLTTPVKSTGAAQSESKSKPVPVRRRAGHWFNWVFWMLLAAIAVVGFVAVERLGDRFEQIRQDAATRSDALAATLQTVQRDAAEALALARRQADIIAQLQDTLAQTQLRYQALQARAPANADETMRLNDVEHLVQQASEQLRLGGRVDNAIAALDIALSRLASPDNGVERPEQVLLRQALQDDLARLQAAPVVDVAARVAQLNRLLALTARAPLLAADLAFSPVSGAVTAPTSPATPPPAAADIDPAAPWWQRAAHHVAAWSARAANGLARDLRGLLSVQRVADPNALLLAPDQAAQLRTTLRLRLLGAQVALLMGQAEVWHSELDAVNAALATYYDGRAPDTVLAAQWLRELLDAAVAAPQLDVAASANAVAVLRAAQAYAPAAAPAATQAED